MRVLQANLNNQQTSVQVAAAYNVFKNPALQDLGRPLARPWKTSPRVAQGTSQGLARSSPPWPRNASSTAKWVDVGFGTAGFEVQAQAGFAIIFQDRPPPWQGRSLQATMATVEATQAGLLPQPANQDQGWGKRGDSEKKLGSVARRRFGEGSRKASGGGRTSPRAGGPTDIT